VVRGQRDAEDSFANNHLAKIFHVAFESNDSNFIGRALFFCRFLIESDNAEYNRLQLVADLLIPNYTATLLSSPDVDVREGFLNILRSLFIRTQHSILPGLVTQAPSLQLQLEEYIKQGNATQHDLSPEQELVERDLLNEICVLCGSYGTAEAASGK